MINKAISAIVTIAFVGLIQTQNPPLWAVAALSIGVYEVCVVCLKIARQADKKIKRRKYITATRLDMRRVEEQVFNPLRNMREVS